ncbi:MAG: DUF4411 family protein [Balneolaceae bacterium]|nr:DUF4411 family protein [Balneolaceae bacterium]
MGKYVVDTSFFTQAHRMYYPLDIADSYWKMINNLISDSKIISIDKVKEEIFDNEDDLTIWIKNNVSSSFFKDTETSDVLENYRKIAGWASKKSNQYYQKAIEEFLEYENADAWLIAYGLTHDKKVVTYENSAPNSKKTIKIPDACNAFDVSCLKPNQMLRNLDVKY